MGFSRPVAAAQPFFLGIPGK